MSLYKFCFFVVLLASLLISSCNCDDNGMPGDPFADCEWMIDYEPATIDSCFTPPRDGNGVLLPSTTIGKEITYMGFSRSDSDIL